MVLFTTWLFTDHQKVQIETSMLFFLWPVSYFSLSIHTLNLENNVESESIPNYLQNATDTNYKGTPEDVPHSGAYF